MESFETFSRAPILWKTLKKQTFWNMKFSSENYKIVEQIAKLKL